MKRSNFLKLAAASPLLFSKNMNLDSLQNLTRELPKTDRLPAVFVGHGSPMNGLADNDFTRHLTKMGSEIEKIQAILVVSAHWLTRGTFVSTTAKPTTIHDFGGFPKELFAVEYPAPGSPDFAQAVRDEVKSIAVGADENWGLDHGAWTVLMHLFPKADVPVFQLSIDYSKPPEWHFNLASELRALRRRGVLVIGSGNIVHNLRRISFDESAKPFDWAVEFDQQVKSFLDKKDFAPLFSYEKLGLAAQLAVPTNDHYLPMLYTLGLQESDEAVRYTFEGFQNGSISMRCFQVSA